MSRALDIRTRIVQQLTQAAPIEWRGHFEEAAGTGEDIRWLPEAPQHHANISRDLGDAAQHAARLAAYWNYRSLGRTHVQAVRRSQQVVTILRRALGYAFVKDTLSF